jgi:shikimate kinase
MGLRGSGKSTLGRLVAQRAGLAFVDLDDVTTSLLGEGTLAELWAQHGEAAFREAEVRALRERVLAPDLPQQVVALGGGTPTAPGAAALLRNAVSRGGIRLVYLRAGPEVLRARLARTDTLARPTLTGHGTLEEIGRVFAARDGVYRALASRVLEIGDRSVAEAAAELAELL